MNLAQREETPRFRSEIYLVRRSEGASADNAETSLVEAGALLQAFFDHACTSIQDGYIWQREHPRVAVGDTTTKQLIVSMRHGGSIEDEWLAVHLLLLATSSKELQGQLGRDVMLIANVCDEDGQVLLIEGADALPDWVQPANAEGRLWIADGQFHLISPDTHAGDAEPSSTNGDADLDEVKPLRTSTALQLLITGRSATLASQEFRDAIVGARLPTYPSLDWARDVQHTTLAHLPSRAAALLQRHPQLLSDAAEAFDGREGPGDARRLREMHHFGPKRGTSSESSSQSGTNLVKVRLPRRLYATLLAQRYFPPKSFGDEWRHIVGRWWELMELEMRGQSKEGQGEEKEGQSKEVEREKDEGRRWDLGCKIACGLELAYANAKERAASAPAKSLFSQGIRSGSSGFEASLQTLGWFGDNTEGSAEWKKRQESANELLEQMQKRDASDDDHRSDETLGLFRGVDTLDTSEVEGFDPTLPSNELALQEDPDGFLYDLPEGVDQHASADGAGTSQEGEEEAERIAMKQINDFAKKLDGFVEGKGDEMGALFEDEGMEAAGEDDDDDDDDDEMKTDESPQTPKQMTNEQRERAMKGLIPGLQPGEWGAKNVDEAKRAAQEADRLESESEPKEAKADSTRVEDVKDPGPEETSTSFDAEKDDIAVSQDDAMAEPILSGDSLRAKEAMDRAARQYARQKVHFDGDSDSEESIDDEILRAGETEEDRRNRATWLGMEQELAEDEEIRRQQREDDDRFDEADDIPLGQDELLNFIEFTRKELKLSEEQYEDILEERRKRGAYVPERGGPPAAAEEPGSQRSAQAKKAKSSWNWDDIPDAPASAPRPKRAQDTQQKREKNEKGQRTTAEERRAASQRAEQVLLQAEEKSKQGNASRLSFETAKTAKAPEQMDAFEQLMHAMDQELIKHKGGKVPTAAGADVKMREQEDEESDEEMGDEEAELLEKLLHGGGLPASLQVLLNKDRQSGEELSSVERQVMEGMLKSFQAQGGGAGPVGSLAGRFGTGAFPRDRN